MNMTSGDSMFRKSFMRDHAAVDPTTVPTVPKLLPPLPRISPKKVSLDQACFQWNTVSEGNKPEKAMICVANMQSDDVAPRRNPLSGIYINYLYSKSACDDYINDSKKGVKYPVDQSDSNMQFDVGGSIDSLQSVVSKTIASSSNILNDYVASWKNGDQTRFLKNYSIATRNGDGLVLAKDTIESMINIWNNSE